LIEKYSFKKICSLLADSLEEKSFELEEILQKASVLRETVHAQEEHFSNLAASKTELENMVSCEDDHPVKASATQHELISTEQALNASGVKLIELAEEKKLLAWQNNHMQVI
jgi:hypothetical protein